MSNKPTSDGQERQPETKKAPIGSVEPIFCKIAAQLEALGYYTQSDRTKPRKMMSAILHGLDAAYWVGVEDADAKLRKENAELQRAIVKAIWDIEVDCGSTLSERVRGDLKQALEGQHEEAKPQPEQPFEKSAGEKKEGCE